MAIEAPMRTRSGAVTDLYDNACELLFAAQQVRQAAGDRAATPALVATIGCLDATLAALREAIDSLRRSAIAELGRDQPIAVAVVEREFAALRDALAAAESVCDQTRERTAPLLAPLTLRRQ